VPAIEATIGSLALGGDGVAHVSFGDERRAIFVGYAAPGDTARLDVDFSRRPARGRLLELLAPGADRVVPACPWSARCGGCDWMHLSVDAQALWHRELVRGVLPVPWRDIAIATRPSPRPLGHRMRARVHVRCERHEPRHPPARREGRAVPDARVEVGMHEAGTHDPVEVESCAVLHPAIEAARRTLATIFEGSRGRGDVLLGLGAGGRPILDVSWRGELAPACFARIEAACKSGALAGAALTLPNATRPATIGDPTPWMTAADGEPLRLAPGGFGQADEAMNALLARHVAELASQDAAQGAAPGKWVELYAGAGNLTVLLAREHAAAGELVTVESSRAACEAARANLAARGLGARVVEADADSYTWTPTTKLVVLDPPRAGARAVSERLALSRVAHVVYVSCDPATLGRDLALLAPAFDLRSVTTFEMFPQTSHVEVVADLVRRRA
jgi:23S rRNA (uracil1939-C5)-methyltransferase